MSYRDDEDRKNNRITAGGPTITFFLILLCLFFAWVFQSLLTAMSNAINVPLP